MSSIVDLIKGVLNESKPAVFVDWFAASQFHEEGGFPVFLDGIFATYDASGNCTYERGIAKGHKGSYETSVRIFSDGFRVAVSGNFGRLNRQDNLFGFDFGGVLRFVNRVLTSHGLPPFSFYGKSGALRTVELRDGRTIRVGGCVVSRLDLTCNFATGSDSKARQVITALHSRSIKRMKRGYSGDESVWWSNTRMMLKAYRKGAEMKKRNAPQELIDYATEQGIVRIEVELKRRELSELGLSHLDAITHEKLVDVFIEEIEPFTRYDASGDVDILSAVPARSRAYAAAWMGGQDLSCLCSRATLFRHAKVLREYGLDILEPRNVEAFPVQLRVIDLVPLTAPEWYEFEKKEAA